MGKEVGIIGIGKVGSRIAASLDRGGHAVTGFDQSPNAEGVARELGIDFAGSCSEVAKGCEVVFLSLPNSAAVRTVVTGSDGLLAGGGSLTTIVDTSTISSHTAQEMAEVCGESGVHFIDSPITGGLVGAASGELNLLMGGDERVVEGLEPIIKSIATTWHYMGPSGSGQAAKLTHNLVGQALVVLFTEAIVIGTSQGLQPRDVYETLRNYTKVYDYCLDKFLERGLSSDFSPRFTLDMAHKDLSEMMELAHSERLPMMLTSLVREIHEMGRSMGLGDEDNTAVLKVYETLVGREMRA